MSPCPLSPKAGGAPAAFLALTATWAVTSSALRAPPLMLLGKYAARPAVPYLASLAMLGVGIAGAVSPYLTMTLSHQDPRLPFVIASVALVLTSLALAKVERTLAKDAPKVQAPPNAIDRAVPAPVIVFALATLVLALGFQLHFFFNSAPLFKQFTNNIGNLMPLFWAGFSVGMFPASLHHQALGWTAGDGRGRPHRRHCHCHHGNCRCARMVVAAQLIAGAAWGCILMSAFAAAAALGATGAEGKTTGLLFSALALATFARMAVTASGSLSNPALKPLLLWAPTLCWAIAGTTLVALSVTYMRHSLTRRTK